MYLVKITGTYYMFLTQLSKIYFNNSNYLKFAINTWNYLITVCSKSYVIVIILII